MTDDDSDSNGFSAQSVLDELGDENSTATADPDSDGEGEPPTTDTGGPSPAALRHPAADSASLGHVATTDGLHISPDEKLVTAFVTTTSRDDVRLHDYVHVPLPHVEDGDAMPTLFAAVEGLAYVEDVAVPDHNDVPGHVGGGDLFAEHRFPMVATLDPITILHPEDADPDAELDRGPVDVLPKPFAGTWLVTDDHYLYRGLNVPETGVPIGHVAVGGDPIPRSRDTPLVYNLFDPDPGDDGDASVFRHTLVAGTTGKGKTVFSKNILRQYAGGAGGPRYQIVDGDGNLTERAPCVVVVDPENEYGQLAQDPTLTAEQERQLDEYADQGFRTGAAEDVVAFVPEVAGTDDIETGAREMEFSIPFEIVEGRPSLLMSFPAEPPTRSAITRVVSDYFDTDHDDLISYDNFLEWVRGEEADYTGQNLVHQQAWNAMLSRIDRHEYRQVFDQGAQSLYDVEHELFRPGRVSVVPTDHLPKGDPRERLVVMALLAHVVENKLETQDPSRHVKHTPIVLAVDEAHEYLASRATARDRYIVDKFVQAAKQGRKDLLGLYMVTQDPTDIDDEIRKQTNTSAYLGLEEAVVETATIPGGYGDRLGTFGKGQAIVKAPDVQPTEIKGLDFCVTQHQS